MNHRGQGPSGIVPGMILALLLLASPSAVRAINPPAHIGQYAHTAWTNRDGYSLGAVFAMAQTRDGYLWLASQNGLARFDGEKFTPWQPPAGKSLPNYPYSLLVSRDGTLWVGTFSGLASWNGVELIVYPELKNGFVTSLLEDRDGTVWAGVIADNKGELCEIHNGRARCHAHDGAFGKFVWSLAEDNAGALWAGADSGLWRWKPGPPKRIELPARVGDLIATADGRLLVGIRGGGLLNFAGDDLEPYPIRSADDPAKRVPDEVVKSNKLLRDREGGIWIGTDGVGLLHVLDGKADSFSAAIGLTGDIACSLFEDREGNIWFASEKGLDRFRKLSVSTLWVKRGPGSEITNSVLASTDGSVWVAAGEGITRWKDGQFRYYRSDHGMPATGGQSLFEDPRGRIWVSTYNGLAYFDRDRFFTVEGQPGNDVISIAGDERNLWLSGPGDLVRFQNDRPVETITWTSLGSEHRGSAVADRGGVWVGHWLEGGVLFFKDGKVLERYSSADGLGAGHVAHLRLDRDGALWAATQSGLSRIKDGRVRTLPIANALPCTRVHWSIEDNRRTLWMNTSCGLVRVTRDDLEAWNADQTRTLNTIRWGVADGVPVRADSPAYSPPVAKAADGKLWFVSGEGIQVVDPDHLSFNTIPPPVFVEQIVADRKPYQISNGVRLPPLVRDVTIEFTALSLTDAQSVQFRYRLDGHDRQWQEAGSRRQAFYTNLGPGRFRFFVKASNNNGVWNEEGTQLEFSIAPAYYQTTWFRLACAVALVGLVWNGFLLHLRRVRREEKRAEDERERLRRLEAQLAHTNRLSMLGELTASLAHEINQPIGAAMASAAAGLRWLDRDQPALQQAREAFMRIKDDSKRAADIITGLRAFYKQEASPPRVLLVVNEVVREMLVLLRREADRHSVVMRTELAPGLPAVRADRVQLQQVLMNLMVNAIEAMGDKGGELLIRTEAFERGIKVSVSDTGGGIPADQMEQIFSAFVTTKVAGTGMGLAISRTIIESHDGKLWAEANAGPGATFRFTLPAAAESPALSQGISR